MSISVHLRLSASRLSSFLSTAASILDCEHVSSDSVAESTSLPLSTYKTCLSAWELPEESKPTTLRAWGEVSLVHVPPPECPLEPFGHRPQLRGSRTARWGGQERFRVYFCRYSIVSALVVEFCLKTLQGAGVAAPFSVVIQVYVHHTCSSVSEPCEQLSKVCNLRIVSCGIFLSPYTTNCFFSSFILYLLLLRSSRTHTTYSPGRCLPPWFSPLPLHFLWGFFFLLSFLSLIGLFFLFSLKDIEPDEESADERDVSYTRQSNLLSMSLLELASEPVVDLFPHFFFWVSSSFFSSPSSCLSRAQKICSLRTLNPYIVRWMLKVRVVERTELLSTKNNGRPFFTADLKDASVRLSLGSSEAEPKQVFYQH